MAQRGFLHTILLFEVCNAYRKVVNFRGSFRCIEGSSEEEDYITLAELECFFKFLHI